MSDRQKQDAIMKSLAIAGFIGIILAISWLSVQFVQLIPNAFSSLASLAGSLQEQSFVEKTEEDTVKPIILTSDFTVVNAGQTVELTWQDVDRSGSYVFSYECAEGVAVDLLNIVGIQSITCDTNYNIGDRNALSFIIDSEKESSATVNYTLSFIGTNDIVPSFSTASSLSVQKDTLADASDLNAEMTTEDETEPIEETVDEVVVTNPIPVKPVVTPRPTTEYVYTMPISNPNGRTDLGVRFIQTGSISGNRFVAGLIERNDTGAIQFAVKNYGTKTSDEWSYSVTLPTGSKYEADDQTPLKPNEEAVIVIGFSTDNDTSHTFRADIDEPTDRNQINDQFAQTITFVR